MIFAFAFTYHIFPARATPLTPLQIVLIFGPGVSHALAPNNNSDSGLWFLGVHCPVTIFCGWNIGRGLYLCQRGLEYT